ncbi:hypothetical protein FQN57_000291 [Myotisia sp. PD_48]|nr:hypothetical protein FQN57_000291 [Myotisia sp. PD_48]
MADALCGPSNALQNFQKHTSVDRTLQQDRLSSHQSPSQGFRSQNQNAGVLDPEFNAFETGPAPLLAERHHPAAFLPPQQLPSHHTPNVAGWAADFQNLQISQRPPQPVLQPQFKVGGPVSQTNATNWHHEFMQESQQVAPQARFQGGMGYQPIMQNTRFTGSGHHMHLPMNNTLHANQVQAPQAAAELFDDSAFEAAFAQVRAETELLEAEQQQLEPIEEIIGQDQLEEAVRIGADTIPTTSDGLNEADELSKTAGALLDRVGNDQSQKFKESSFLALMRQLRDRELVIDGDKFREAAAHSLHPGGPLYPEQSRVSSQSNTDPTTSTTINSSTGDSTHNFRYHHDFENSNNPGYNENAFNTSSEAHTLHEGFSQQSYPLVDHRIPNPPDCFTRRDFERQLKQSLAGDTSLTSETRIAIALPDLPYIQLGAYPYRSPLPVQPCRTTDITIVENDNHYSLPPPIAHSPGPSASNSSSPEPPPFSSLYSASFSELDQFNASVTESGTPTLPAFAPAPQFEETPLSSPPVVSDTKAALSRDKSGESSSKSQDESEPPPPYTEGSIPLQSFTYVMAATGGPASIITQVQQTGGPPINTLGDIGGDEHITLDLRGTRFTLSRDELLTLPEFVLLSLFPNGLLPDGHMGTFHEGDVYPVDYDPVSLQYMLDFFRTVAETIPSSPPSPTTSMGEPGADSIQGSAGDMLPDRAGIIVLREDLDFYAIPPNPDIEHSEMIEVKRAAGRALLKQDGIFSGLRKSDEPGTTEQHLIEMLTAGGFNHDDRWGHRAGEPNKAVICSLALAKLRTGIRGDHVAHNNFVGMAQKLLLFWRKPARRCWWEGVELENVEGVEGKLKVWIRRVWTLEMSVIGLR